MPDVEDIYELTPMQHGMLFHSLYAPEEGLYCQQMSCVIEGSLDPATFRAAWQKVVERHGIFRTSFHWEQIEKPVQVVHKRAELPLDYQDWRGLDPAEQRARLDALLTADRAKGYDLSKLPLTRLTLIRTGESLYRAVWSFHHMLIDGWCLPIILKEVFLFYESLARGEDLHLNRTRPYRDYIVWLQQQDLTKAEEFWRRALAGFETPTPLIKNEVLLTAPGRVEDRALLTVELPPATAARLNALTRQHQLTLNTLAQGAWALLLGRYSGQEDVVFGATVSGRPAWLTGSESMVGLFINTLPVRVALPADETVLPWLKQLQKWAMDMRQYEYSPLVQVHGWSDVPRTLPLFESIMVFENYPVDQTFQEQKRELQVRDVMNTNWNNYPLTILVMPGEKFLLRVNYDCRRFDEATIGRMLAHYQTLLEAIASDPGQRLADLPLLTEAERRQLVVEMNSNAADFPQDKLIHELFEARAQENPGAVAVVCEGEQLSYGELNARANRLAHYLRARGVGPDVLVGIFLKRSLDMVVGLLGALKAGGGYFPLDPAFPKQRLAFMLEDSKAPVIVSRDDFARELPEHGAQVIRLDSDADALAAESDRNPGRVAALENVAYVIYTSGSTGRPKGVVIEHRQILNYTHAFMRRVGFEPGASCAMVQPLTVDSCKTVLFPSLCSGGSLHVIPHEQATDPLAVAEHFAVHRIDVLKIAPSHLATLCAGVSPARVLPRRWLIIGGEASRSDWVRELCVEARPGCKVFNHYGPTEATVGMLMFGARADDEHYGTPVVPMGRPLANTKAYVLDGRMRPVPVGVPGELHIGGDCVARGYLGHPEKTAEKFIPDPFSAEPGARLYKTGDVVRHLPDGDILFLGRVDDQIKIRGFRIELKEIEAELNGHPAVRDSVVIAQDEPSGNKRLIGYVVADPGSAPTTSELRAFLKERLPDYMVASHFVVLDALPLTPHGKIDRRALPTVEQSRPEIDELYVAPRTPLEEQVAGLWAGLLGVEQVGVNDNFFELGGHSLMAAQLVFRLNELFQLELPVRRLFESPTVDGLVLAVVEQQAGRVEPEKMSRILAEIEQLSEDEAQWMLVSP